MSHESTLQHPRSASVRGAVYGLSAAAIWGGMYVVSDVVLQSVPPFTLLSIRLLMAIAVLGLIIRRTPNVVYPTPRERLKLMGVGLVGFGVSLGAQFVGTDLSTAINGSLVTSAAPAFILIFAAMILRERLTVVRIAAVALATIGVIVIVDLARANFSSTTFLGDISLAVAAVTWGLFSVLSKLVSKTNDTTIVTWYSLIGGACLTIPVAIIELTARPIGVIDAGTIIGMLYLGIVSTAVAMWLWNRAFALVDASVASLFFFAQPLVGTLLSVIILSQQMTSNLWIGSFLIIVGVLLSLFPSRVGGVRVARLET